MQYLYAYLATVSVLAVILTLYDKNAAKKRRWRIRENTLLLIAALGGSVAMLLTMLSIRHKTKHIKFMLGIRVIILVQVAAMMMSNCSTPTLCPYP